jgi:hypothetical protein
MAKLRMDPKCRAPGRVPVRVGKGMTQCVAVGRSLARVPVCHWCCLLSLSLDVLNGVGTGDDPFRMLARDLEIKCIFELHQE